MLQDLLLTLILLLIDVLHLLRFVLLFLLELDHLILPPVFLVLLFSLELFDGTEDLLLQLLFLVGDVHFGDFLHFLEDLLVAFQCRGDLLLLLGQDLFGRCLYLLDVGALLLPDALDLVLQQDKVRVELVDDILLDLTDDVLMVDLGLLLGGICDDLAEFLAQNLVFLRTHLFDVEIEMPTFVV